MKTKRTTAAAVMIVMALAGLVGCKATTAKPPRPKLAVATASAALAINSRPTPSALVAGRS